MVEGIIGFALFVLICESAVIAFVSLLHIKGGVGEGKKVAAAIRFGIILQLVGVAGLVKKGKEAFFMKRSRKTSGFIILFEGGIILLTFVLIIACSAGVTEFGNSLANFFDFPSLFMVLLFTVPVLFASGMAKDFAKVILIGKKPCSLAQMKKTLEAIKMLQRLALCGAGFATLIEITIIMQRLDDLSAFGPNLAVAVLVTLYGLIIEAILIPLSAYVQNHITDAMNVEKDDEEA